MPQASEEDRAMMKRWFGDPIDCEGPMKLLLSHGFSLSGDALWRKPARHHAISEIEWRCINFLIDEWDFGGIEDK